MKLFIHATVPMLLLFALVLAAGDAILTRYGAPQWAIEGWFRCGQCCFQPAW